MLNARCFSAEAVRANLQLKLNVLSPRFVRWERCESIQRDYFLQMRWTSTCSPNFRSTLVNQHPLLPTASVSHSTTATLDFCHSASKLTRVNPSVSKPSWEALRVLFVSSAVPMVGFGFMDNFVMIQAGQYIDSTIGVSLGLATLTAAACGQVVSDVSGVVFGGSLERLLIRLNFIQTPALSQQQRQLPICRNIAMLGAVLGVICGCALGATTLMFVDLEARDRIRHAHQLREIVSDMVHTSRDDSIGCDSCTVYVSSKKDFTLDASLQTDSRNTTLDFIHNAASKDVCTCVDTREVFRSFNRQHLYAPILKGEEVIAVMEFKGRPGDEYSSDDVAKAKVLSRHLGIVLKHIIE